MMVPVELRDAYCWVDAAGQIDELIDLSTADAARYASEAFDNFAECAADGPDGEWAGAEVTVEGLLALRQFLILRRAADDDDALRDRLEYELDHPTLENR
jgi:hypothetical protein